MKQLIRKHHIELLTLLEEVVNINSITGNIEGIKKIGNLFQNVLESLGLNTKWTDEGHLVATWQWNDKEKPKILLIGHLDTVHNQHKKFNKFFIEGNYACGPGIFDMKGGDVLILGVIRLLKETNELNNFSFKIVFTCDEEKPKKPLTHSRNVLLEDKEIYDLALGFEFSENFNKVITGRRGSGSWKITTLGQPGHGKDINTENYGSGAAYELSRILFQIYRELESFNGLSINPGLILAGEQIDFSGVNEKTVTGKANSIAKESIAIGDFRFLNKYQKEKGEELFKKVVSSNLSKTTSSLEFVNAYPPMECNEGNIKLLNIYSKVSNKLNYGHVSSFSPADRGAADISIISEFCPSLDGLGVYGMNAHSDNERIDLRFFSKQLERVVMFLIELKKQT